MVRKYWTEDEISFLKENYPLKGISYCAEKLNRTTKSVDQKAFRLKLTAPGGKLKTHREYEDNLFNKEIDAWPLENYINDYTPILHTCLMGHTWKARPSNILRGHACPDCAKSGFQLDKPAILYYIKVQSNDKSYYKLGITNRDVYTRFNRDKDKKITILYECNYSLGIQAKLEEQRLFEKFKEDRKHVHGFLNSGGNSELFEKDILNLDLDLEPA